MSAILFTSPAVAQPAPDGIFTLTVTLQADFPVTGLDYSLGLTNAILEARDVQGSSFPDLIDLSLLGDLGASVGDVNVPVEPGTHLVASFQFRVKDFAQPALVTPQPYPGTIGVAGAAPTFAETPFTGVGSTVAVPEPGLIAGLLLAVLWRFIRRVSSSAR